MARRPWTPAEDAALRRAVAGRRRDAIGWDDVAARVGLAWRGGKGCRRRWLQHLDPELNRSKFTEEESRTIVIGFVLMGCRWSRIARNLPGRTDGAVRNYWKNLERRWEKILSQILSSPRLSDAEAVEAFTADKDTWRENTRFLETRKKEKVTENNSSSSSSSSSEEASSQLPSESCPEDLDISSISCTDFSSGFQFSTDFVMDFGTDLGRQIDRSVKIENTKRGGLSSESLRIGGGEVKKESERNSSHYAYDELLNLPIQFSNMTNTSNDLCLENSKDLSTEVVSGNTTNSVSLDRKSVNWEIHSESASEAPFSTPFFEISNPSSIDEFFSAFNSSFPSSLAAKFSLDEVTEILGIEYCPLNENVVNTQTKHFGLNPR